MKPRHRALCLIYGTLLVPFVGPGLLVMGSSAAYYYWRSRDPLRARYLNRHAWIAIGLNAAANVAWLVVSRR